LGYCFKNEINPNLADGLVPPFYAQIGPSILDANIFLKNTGSGIKWESLAEVSDPLVSAFILHIDNEKLGGDSK
jgi:hypothetical protein